MVEQGLNTAVCMIMQLILCMTGGCEDHRARFPGWRDGLGESSKRPDRS